MREINNSTGNLNHTNFQKVDSKKDVTQSLDKDPNIEEKTTAPVTDNLSQSPEAIIGRSQVSKADSLENDMKIMLNNPEVVNKTLAFCGLAEKMLKEQGIEDAYEKASILANAFKDEFLSK